MSIYKNKIMISWIFQEIGDDEDNDLDLFGDETDEEKKAVEAHDQAKASTKKKECEFPFLCHCQTPVMPSSLNFKPVLNFVAYFKTLHYKCFIFSLM